MFTGLIEQRGSLISREETVLLIQAPAWESEPLEVGESIAVNGCCLTLIEQAQDVLRFDLSQETLAKTSLKDLAPGAALNLERALRIGDRLGGHLVQGHVDGTGRCRDIRPQKGGFVFQFEVPPGNEHLLIDKGSIAVDGISLTIVDPGPQSFEVWVIPHTYKVTNLGEMNPGDRVNIEFDSTVKAIARQVDAYLSKRLSD